MTVSGVLRDKDLNGHPFASPAIECLKRYNVRPSCDDREHA